MEKENPSVGRGLHQAASTGCRQWHPGGTKYVWAVPFQLNPGNQQKSRLTNSDEVPVIITARCPDQSHISRRVEASIGILAASERYAEVGSTRRDRHVIQ